MENSTAQNKGEVLGHAAAKDAATSAGAAWQKAAWDFFTAWAKARNGEPFLGEDARHAAEGLVPPTSEPRAWGYILAKAARQKLIVRTGYAAVKDRKGHGRPMTVWVW